LAKLCKAFVGKTWYAVPICRQNLGKKQCLEYGRFFSYVPSCVLVKCGMKLFLDGKMILGDATKKQGWEGEFSGVFSCKYLRDSKKNGEK